VAAAQPVVGEILHDVERKSGGRRMLETMLFEQLRQTLPGSAEYVLEQAAIPDYINPPASGWTVRYEFRLPQTGIGRAMYSAPLRDSRTATCSASAGW